LAVRGSLPCSLPTLLRVRPAPGTVSQLPAISRSEARHHKQPGQEAACEPHPTGPGRPVLTRSGLEVGVVYLLPQSSRYLALALWNRLAG
jgi:hypothetical protein